MSLSEELASRLDTSSSLSILQGSAGSALSEMDTVSMPEMGDDFSQLEADSGNIDLSGITSEVTRALGDLGPAIAALPAANQTLAPINQVIDLAAQLASLDLPNNLRALAENIDQQLSGNAGFLDKINTLTSLLEGNTSLQGMRDLISTFAELSGHEINPSDLQTGDLIPAFHATANAIGGLMSLQTQLEEAGRLSLVIRDQLDTQQIDAAIGQVEKQLGINSNQSLAAFIRGIDVTDSSQVAAAHQAIENAVLPVSRLSQAIAEGMAFGEATLVHLDPQALNQAIQHQSQQLGSLDLAPLERGVNALAERLRPLFAIDLGNAPARDLNGWLGQLESRVAGLASGIDSYDFDSLTKPITQGIETLMLLPNQLTSALQALRLTIQQALQQIQSVIEAIPLDLVADTIRRVLAPIVQALEFITDLVTRIQDLLGTAVSTLQNALDTSEDAVDTVRESLENLFRQAAGYLEELNLEGVIGEVSEQVQAFAELLAKADMEPYFESVADAIGTTADVIDKVPFELLPDSMEQEVVDAVRPVKSTNVEALSSEIKNLLQIGPDGEFQLRPELEAALQQIQDKYDDILDTLRAHDPRALLADLNSELDALQQRIENLAPSVALDPVQNAIDDVKRMIGEFDLDATLQPLRDGFDQVLEKVDEYQPSLLLQETENRLTEARNVLFDGLRLDDWTEQLDNLRREALALIEPLDPEQLQPQLERLLTDLQSQAAGLPQLELGYALGSLLSAVFGAGQSQPRADSFGAVLGWMQNGAATEALAKLARETAGRMDTALAGVQQVDPQAIILRLQPALQSVRDAVQSLPDGQAKTDLARLTASLDIETPLAGFGVQRQRYLVTLQQASSSFTVLANSGLSEVDITVSRLLQTLSPLDFARNFMRDLLAVIGIEGLDQGLQQVVKNTFAVATPARLTSILQPLFSALKGRVEAMLDSFFNPVLAAVNDLKALRDQLSLAGIMTELDAVHGAARGQIAKMHPDELLGEAVDAFNDTQAQVLAFDPLGPINDALTALRGSTSRVLGKLDAEAILATPLAVYDDLLRALELLDLQQILAPVLDTLDLLASQVDTGVDNTVTRFKQLQSALPDQVGSTSTTVSAGVS